ncbi:MAG TPA: hypothetical protein VEA36_01675 [Candidatus Paceibacterota bacterium]|nr:hypothetical protein [Candidatus Paceibacterota bacterium]
MDELTIGDKIYISSKQAAKITGYAKDYVGQLCREGRVDAKLVGRNWYVLESSIREHRFGKETLADVPQASHVEERISPVSAWEAPRYAPMEDEPAIPPLEAIKPAPAVEDSAEAVALMQDAWKEWFASREQMQAEQEAVIEEATPEPIIEEPTKAYREEEVSEEEPVRVSDIPSNYSVEKVSQDFEDEERIINMIRMEREVEHEPEIPHEPVMISRTRMTPEPVYEAPRPRAQGSVIDLSRAHQEAYTAPQRPIARPTQVQRQHKTRTMLTAQALMLSIAGLSILAAVIGSGALDNALASQGIESSLRGAIFDTLRGESTLKK